MGCDLLDWCQGPEGGGCEFERRDDHRGVYVPGPVLGRCRPCGIELREDPAGEAPP